MIQRRIGCFSSEEMNLPTMWKEPGLMIHPTMRRRLLLHVSFRFDVAVVVVEAVMVSEEPSCWSLFRRQRLLHFVVVVAESKVVRVVAQTAPRFAINKEMYVEA